MLISQERADAICDELAAAGARWSTVAATIPEVRWIHAPDEVYRGRCELHGPVATLFGPCEAVLYRHEGTGDWWCTGWASDSKLGVYQPGAAPAPAIDAPTLDLWI